MAIDAVVVQKVVKADPDPTGVPGPIGRGTQTDQHVHLAHETIGTVCQSQPDLAMAHMRLEIVEEEQRLGINIDVDAAEALSVPPVATSKPPEGGGTPSAIRQWGFE